MKAIGIIACCAAAVFLTAQKAGAVDESIPDPFASLKAEAEKGSQPVAIEPNTPIVIPSPPTFDAKSWVLMDAATGQLLMSHNPHEKIWPASLTKMMTSYVIGMEFKAGRLHPDDEVLITNEAWSKNYSDSSKMFIEVGKKVRAEDLNKGIIIQSGNDACAAMAIHLAGSESGFVSVMNTYAKRLNLGNTNFANVHGLFDENNYSTAYDMALLGRALIRDLPEEYSIYSQKEFTFNGIKQLNRNRLLWDSTLNVDGIKTGHLSQSGYNLAASAVEGDMRLIAVVIGAASEEARADFCRQMLTYGFRYYESYTPFNADQSILEREVRLGDLSKVELTVTEPVNLMIPRGSQNRIRVSYKLTSASFKAPIQKGEQLGVIDIRLDDQEIASFPLVAKTEIKEGGFFSRLWDRVYLFFAED